MKIQFIIAGWHFNYEEFIQNLKELELSNSNINVFWSCHREPSLYIKENFKYKVFLNGGEECGAYDQAINYLNLEEDTICFFMHDDMVVKDWDFINVCIDKLHKGYKIIGNGRDYNDVLDPSSIPNNGVGISEEFDNKPTRDYVKPQNQHLFDQPLNIVKVRPSFICMQYKNVDKMGGFEPRNEAYIPPLFTKDEWCDKDQPHYRGGKGLSSFGNLFPRLNCYKMNKIFSPQSITWLSDTYVDSKYLYECQRGKVDLNTHPMT